jgi:Ca2+:H+ antiporter
VEPLYWLLLALPAAIILKLLHTSDLWLFVVSCVAIIPLAGLMGRATENLAETLGAGIGGLLNASFGNAAELIIAFVALRKGPDFYPLIKASLTGSIIGNTLLVFGLAILVGGIRHSRQVFNRTAATAGAALLALATVSLIMPTIYQQVVQPTDHQQVVSLSEELAIILAVTYLLSLLFSLRTHKHLFAGPEENLPTTGAAHQPEWNRRTSLIVLTISTIGVAMVSEFLVGSVEHAGESLGLNNVFVGVIVVAVVGNAAEHSTAVLMAAKNKMDLAINIAVGSSLQIALFVAPILVFASWAMGQSPALDLHFTLMETITVALTVAVFALVCQDGETHWMEGVMLLAVYAMFALAFFHLPSGH